MSFRPLTAEERELLGDPPLKGRDHVAHWGVQERAGIVDLFNRYPGLIEDIERGVRYFWRRRGGRPKC